MGPCYARSIARQDITEGQPGIPTRLSFLVVDAQCKPIQNAEIDIWHAGPRGVYSGNDAEPMCTNDAPAALAGRFFRGKQTSDARGRVDFDTCFPGWYRGRTVHVHFTARVFGAEMATSQLVFDDALVDELMQRPVYRDRGKRDTTNTIDGVMSGGNLADYTFRADRIDGGAILASKALILRSSTDTKLCSLGGPGGPGGPPPAGGFRGPPPPGFRPR